MEPNEITDVLNRPISQELLARDVTRLACVAKDDTPRNVPIGFTWNGSEIVMCTTKNAPMIQASSGMRHGRLVLAGEAAHIHSPAGGQGMNLGIRDAYDLGHRLAAYLSGQIAIQALDEYDTERRAEAKESYETPTASLDSSGPLEPNDTSQTPSCESEPSSAPSATG